MRWMNNKRREETVITTFAAGTSGAVGPEKRFQRIALKSVVGNATVTI